MHIPERLRHVLERDQSLDGPVRTSIARFEPWIKNSALPFFPEYTKHDIEHIEAVLRTAVSLTRDESWEFVTAGDAAVLILSVLLHDCAMHLTESGFFALIGDKWSNKVIKGLPEKSWNILWEDFFSEAARFDGRKLKQIFGNIEPVQRPSTDPLKLTKRDRLLIGEFLRRHHPRLAHEIAMFGVPTSGEEPLLLEGFSGAADHIPKMAGLVARSHGHGARHFLPYLETEFGDLRQYRGVHAVFLMTLLRVGDYLQIDAERAPKGLLKVKQLASPVSLGEWKAHAAIQDVRNTHHDPEAVFVDALPEDVDTFLRVRAWLEGIQRELDSSWAVLGEVYGRYTPLDKLGLALRRVRSSLDDLAAFSKRVNYIPKKAFFRAADADLLKLLIEPLYGDKPEIGLRELIQNAVDAVRELKQYQDDVPASKNAELNKQDTDVLVSIDKDIAGIWSVTVSDRGIGMTSEIVTDYFLAAGASFRRSEHWRKLFESDAGKSKVLRAGRFGVGALASFLLGSEIEVSTRHIEADIGMTFKASVDSDAIELWEYSRPVGTTIKVRIPEEIAMRLARKETYGYGREGYVWDWYFLPEPSLKRVFQGKEFPSRCQLPALETNLPINWHKTSHPQFSGVLWTYSQILDFYKDSVLICNGIFVTTDYDAHYSRYLVPYWESQFGLTPPVLSVFDPNGCLPLNLQRDRLAMESLPFESELVADITKDFVAFALVHGSTKTPKDFRFENSPGAIAYPGSARRYPRTWWTPDASNDWYFTAEGFGLMSPSIVKMREFRSLLYTRIDGGDPAQIKISFDDKRPILIAKSENSLTTLDSHVRQAVELGYSLEPKDWNWGQEAIYDLKNYQRTGVRLVISTTALSRAANKGQFKLTRALKAAMQIELEIGDWHVYRIGKCPSDSFDFEGLLKKNSKHLGDRSLILEIYFDHAKPAFESLAVKHWREIIGETEIPFDEELRRKKFKHVYKKLADYINAHEAAKKTKKPTK